MFCGFVNKKRKKMMVYVLTKIMKWSCREDELVHEIRSLEKIRNKVTNFGEVLEIRKLPQSAAWRIWRTKGEV